ncbi:MAG TPA: glycosyltransferase family 4 protein [Alphaproteobacteria bacterium]|nr:glycosyltransferase family 4 protein [Alphaproteobacteria bacterium]
MDYLFVHQNCPGQFKHLAPRLAARPDSRVAFISKPGRPTPPGVTKVEYKLGREPTPNLHRYLRNFEQAVIHGQAVARAALALKNSGFRPGLIYAHPGWGEALFLKDVFPDAKVLHFCEFYYHAHGADVGFEPGEAVSLDDEARLRIKNANNLMSLEACDWGISPTRWQWQQYPAEFRDRISVVFDGVDTAVCRPVPEASLTLPDGRVLRRGQEVVTYVARNLEPYRGFHVFMRAAAEIQRRRPEAQIVVVGGDQVSYGRGAPDGRTWRETLLDEVGPALDASRIHFLGWVPYERYLEVLRVSAAHVYLTYPFVLSWSMMEAMASECLIVGSATPPVMEVVEDGVNGLLTDFHDPAALAARVAEALAHPDRHAALRAAARRTVVERYALEDCIGRQLGVVDALLAGRRPDLPAPLPLAPVPPRPPAGAPTRVDTPAR